MLDGYLYTCKICQVYPSNILNSQDLEGGNFVVQNSGRQFSQIHFDQAQSETIKSIKVGGCRA